MKIGCEVYIKKTDTVVYHVVTVDEVTIQTKCGGTDLRIYWDIIQEGKLSDVNCPICLLLSDTD